MQDDALITYVPGSRKLVHFLEGSYVSMVIGINLHIVIRTYHKDLCRNNDMQLFREQTSPKKGTYVKDVFRMCPQRFLLRFDRVCVRNVQEGRALREMRKMKHLSVRSSRPVVFGRSAV